MSPLCRLLIPCVAVCLAVPAGLAAQGWQGVIRTREITFDIGLFSDRVGDDPGKIVDLPLTDILAAGSRPDAEEFAYSVSEASLKLKGARIRTDVSGELMAEMGVGYGIMNVDDGMMYMVMPERQMIVEMNVEELEELMKNLPRPDPGPPPEVEQLGQTRVINGVRCTAYEVRSADDVTVAWVSDADAQLHAIYRRFGDLVRRMDPEDVDPDLLLAPYGFPMLSYRISGTSVTIEETIALDREPVPDSEFELPTDFQRISMLEMMRGQMEQIRRD